MDKKVKLTKKILIKLEDSTFPLEIPMPLRKKLLKDQKMIKEKSVQQPIPVSLSFAIRLIFGGSYTVGTSTKTAHRI